MILPSVTHPIGDFVRENVPNLLGYLPDFIQPYIPSAEIATLINIIICMVAIAIIGIAPVPVLIYMERKVCAHIQCRLGPMRLGPHGVLQLVADIAKLLFKEVYAPKGADKFLFYLAPIFVLTAPFLNLCVIPFDKNLQVADLSVAIPFILAMNGFGILSTLLGGWASNNKYSLISSLRSGAQIISYEISFAMILLLVVMLAGSASLGEITASQSGHFWDWWIFKAPGLGILAFLMFLVSSTAELNRAPFDIAEAEQELTGGFHTEYNGMAFAMFYLAEYINLFTTSCIATVCFLGGYHAPTIGILAIDNILNFVPGIVWFLAKTFFVVWIYMMFRWTFVRPRVDQLMALEWKFLLPANLLLLILGVVFLAFGWILP